MGKDSWWDWRAESSRRDAERRPNTEGERLTLIEDLAERCVILDNLAANVTHATIRSALGQFGAVLGVKMVINQGNMTFIGVAIAEMSTTEQRNQVVQQLREYLFMVGAMPKPARAIPATPLLLIDHPWRRNPNMVRPRLVSKNEPGAEHFRERETKARIAASDCEVLQQAMEREEIHLEKTQAKQCQELLEKLNMIAKEQKSGTIRQMRILHGMPPR